MIPTYGMDFLERAQRSSQSITCQTVRCILFEISAEALRQIIQSRPQQQPQTQPQPQPQHPTDEDNNSSFAIKEVEITREDIHESYAVADRIGRRWAEKLHVKHEEEYATIVELVVRNGRYLDLNFRDDVTKLKTKAQAQAQTHLNHNHDRISAGDSAATNAIDDHSGIDMNTNTDTLRNVNPNSNIADAGNDAAAGIHSATNTNNNPSLEVEQGEQTDDKSDNEANLQSDSDGDDADDNGIRLADTNANTHGSANMKPLVLPYMTLFNLGQTDPCNLHLYSNSKVIKGTSSEWHPLPALSTSTNTGPNTNAVHIPNPTIMPLDKIRAPTCQSQLYGPPACELPPKFASTSTREQISLIDKMAYSGDTMWAGDWDIIQDVVERNRERMKPHIYSGKKRKRRKRNGNGADSDSDDEVVEIVPRSLINYRGGGGEEDDNNNGDEEVVYIQNKDDQNMRFITVNDKWSTCNQEMRREQSNRRRRLLGDNEQIGREGRTINVTRECSREPSALGYVRWSSQDIKDSLGDDAQKKLEMTMLHSDEVEVEADKNYNICYGALKNVGSVHLWEQIKAKKWKGPADVVPASSGGDYGEPIGMDAAAAAEEEESKATLDKRKAAHRLARRWRIFPHSELKNAPRDTSKLSSKVIWATKNDDGDTRIDEKQQWMELDVGECIVSLPTPDYDISPDRNEDRKKKTTLAFRSLEVSLVD